MNRLSDEWMEKAKLLIKAKTFGGLKLNQLYQECVRARKEADEQADDADTQSFNCERLTKERNELHIELKNWKEQAAEYSSDARISEQNAHLIGEERDSLEAQLELCKGANESVSVCANHTDDIKWVNGLDNGCWVCEANQLQDSLFEYQNYVTDIKAIIKDAE